MGKRGVQLLARSHGRSAPVHLQGPNGGHDDADVGPEPAPSGTVRLDAFRPRASYRFGVGVGWGSSLTVDDESYTNLKRSAGERGLPAADFGAWLGENVRIGVDAPAEVRTTLALLAVDAGGTILYEGKVPLQAVPKKGDHIWLGQAGSASALSRLLDEFFSGRGSAPQGGPVPAFPADQGGETFVTVVNGYRRMGARAGAQALRDQGLSHGGVALVLLALPEPCHDTSPRRP